jgi:hypothetical protein
MEVSFAAAAANAAARAEECHRRVEALQDGVPVGDADVTAAKTALRQARRRAVDAFVRSELDRHRRPHAQVPPTADSGPVLAELHGMDEVGFAPSGSLQRLRSRTVAIDELHTQYWAMGGGISVIELDGYLHGAIQLPRLERALIEQALWELETTP